MTHHRVQRGRVANLAPTQIEQLQSIGAHLRQVRQEQGLSLDVLANQIFIRPALLQALETGHGDQLPEPVFIQGFIRRYAEALGLDGKAISQEFVVTPVNAYPAPAAAAPAVSEPPAAAPENPAIPAPVPVAAAAPKPAPTQTMDKPRPMAAPVVERSFAFPLWLALGAGALVIGGLLWALLGRNPNPETVTSPSAPTEDVETPADPTEESESPEAVTPSPEPETPSVALEAPIVATVNLSDRAWMSVVADGRTLYEGTPEGGYEETWTAQNSLVIRTGNAGGVSLAVNGEDPVVLGQAGVVRTVTLTPDSTAETLR